MAVWSSRKMVREEVEEQDCTSSSGSSTKSSSSFQRWSWRRPRFSNLSSFGWKGFDLQARIVDKLVFKLLYVLEAVVVVSTICFFFLCCGCGCEYSFFQHFEVFFAEKPPIPMSGQPRIMSCKPCYHSCTFDT